MTTYICTATLTWKQDSWHGRSALHSRIVNLNASSEGELYERMAAFRIKNERIEGQPDEDGDTIQWDDAVSVSFGPLMRAEIISDAVPERIQATEAWKAHEKTLAAHAERERLRLAEEAEEEAREQQAAQDAEMAAYLRVKSRLETKAGTAS